MPAYNPAGQPHEPTIHPRTRPEANEYALKNRTTNDWLRHDGKNFEVLPKPATRNGVSRLAAEIAIKARGDAANWFEHNPNAPPQARPPSRCTTPESRVAQARVYGKEELWYKHDDNMHYYDRVPNRLGVVGGEEIKNKFVSHEASQRTRQWYMHEHEPNDGYKPAPVKHNTGPIKAPVLENERKIHGEAGAPKWFEHSSTSAQLNAPPAPKVATREALETWMRDRGSSADWFEHDDAVGEPQSYRPCVGSKEGEEIARRLAGESKDWFKHDPRNSEGEMRSKKMSAPVQEMLDKDRTGKMRQVLGFDEMGSMTPVRGGRSVKPEAAQIARLSSAGSMSQIFNQAANKNYTDPLPGGGRVIRPEAQATFDKNKGVMSDCFQGYRDQPWKKQRHKLPPDNEIAAKHAGSSMEGVFKGTGPPDSGRFHMARGVRPEAQAIAEKHRGSSMFDVFVAGHEDFVRKEPRVRSELALEIAHKNSGYVSDFIR